MEYFTHHLDTLGFKGLPVSNLRRPPEKILSRDAAYRLLLSYFDDLVESVRTGITMYNTIPGKLRAGWRPRTHASVLNDYIITEARERLDGMPGVKINDDHQGAFFVVKGKAALRFKKIADGGRPVSYPTPRQRCITWQTEIEGIPKATYVDVQYLPNDVWTEIKTVSLACYNGRRLWEFPIAGQLETYLFDSEGEAKQGGPKVRSTRKGRGTGSDE